MRICILGDSSFVPVRNLVRYLVGESVEVHVAGFGRLDVPSPVRTHALPPSRLAVLGGRGRVQRLVNSVGPDVVHAFYLTSYGYLSSRVAGYPVLVTAMGSDVFGAPDLARWLRPFRDALAKSALRRADRIHSVAAHMTEQLVAMGADPEKIVTFPRGVPVEKFSGPRAADPQGGPLRIVCNRKLEPVYDHATLLKAAALLRDRGLAFVLDVFGEGYLRQGLESMARELDVDGQVRFRGAIAYEEMPRALQDSDVFVSPSLSDGTSSCLLEALAAGCIPVASDIPANRPWITRGGAGFLFAPADPEALAGAVVEAAKARVRWPAMRESNRALVAREGSIDAGHARVLGMYRELMRRSD